MLLKRKQIQSFHEATDAPWRAPVWQAPARLGWEWRRDHTERSDAPQALMRVTPVFPGCHPALFERGIVWDPAALREAARRAGGHQVLVVGGHGPERRIEDSVRVSHPDARTIVWELDLQRLGVALDEAVAGTAQDGFIRLLFDRNTYEADLRELWREVQAHVGAPVPGDDGLIAWPREPVWPANTRVEFGYFEDAAGPALMRVNGKLERATWPGWNFPRWEAMHAFRRWLDWTALDASWPPKPQASGRDGRCASLRYLRQEADRTPCHDAGRRLARVLQTCLNEAATAPGVTVTYVECPLAAGPVAQAGPTLVKGVHHRPPDRAPVRRPRAVMVPDSSVAVVLNRSSQRIAPSAASVSQSRMMGRVASMPASNAATGAPSWPG